MILFFFICAISVSQTISQSCSTNKTYGENCNLTCSYCLLGCDVSGSCINSTCTSQYYGTTCKYMLPSTSILSLNLVRSSNPCRGVISINPVTNSSINVANYSLIYGDDQTLNFSDPDIGRTPQISLGTNINISLNFPSTAWYRFGVYFIFENIDLYGLYTSSISPILRTYINTQDCTANITIPVTPSTMTPLRTTPTVPTSSPMTDFIIRNLVATPNFNSIEIRWDPPNNIIGLVNFNLNINPTGQTLTVPSTNRSYTFINLAEGTRYTITVTSVYSSGQSYPVSAFVNTLDRSAPTNLVWNKTLMQLTWVAPTTTTYTGFKIYLNNNPADQLARTITLYRFTSLLPGQQYSFAVAAVYDGRESQISTIGFTLPAAFSVPLNLPTFPSISATTSQVMFPEYNPTNYNGTINVYYLAIRPTTGSARRKRDTFSCSPTVPGIPSNAAISYASNVSPGNQPIVLGSGNTIAPLNCANQPLQPNTNYTVYAIIGSLIDNSSSYQISQSSFVTPSLVGPNVGMIIGIIIALLLLLILIMLLLLYFLKWKKTKNQFYGFKGPYDDIKPMSYLYWSTIDDKMEPRKIVLDKDNIHMFLTFKEEYDSLPKHPCLEQYGVELSTLNCSQDGNADELLTCGLSSTNCVVTFIDGYIKKKAFISLRSPYNDETFSEFWFMVYSRNVGQIVMFAQEGEMMKYNCYWPNKSAVYDQIEVTMLKEVTYAYYDVRVFRLRKMDGKENIRVTHYLYRGWPANDGPVNIVSFLDFHQIIKRSESIIFGPTVVHSHTDWPLNVLYICFDILYDQLNQENEVNVFRTCAQLKRHIPNMSININQYMMLYDLLFESYFGGQYVVDAGLKNSMNSSSGSFWRFLEAQFRYIDELDFMTSHNSSTKGNYLILDSVEYRQSIVMRRYPMPTVEESIELWGKVFANNISTIVDFKYRNIDEMFYVSQQLLNYTVSVKNVVRFKNDVISQTVSVTQIGTNNVQNVIIYSLDSRNVGNFDGEQCEAIVELIDNILNDSQFNMLVFEVENLLSSVFIACLNAATKLNLSKFVSVYYTIRSLQSPTCKIVQNEEQYKFIHEFLELWIDMKLSHSNVNDKISLNMTDPDSQYVTGPYGKLNTLLNNNSMFSPYSSVTKSSPQNYKTTEA